MKLVNYFNIVCLLTDIIYVAMYIYNIMYVSVR